MAKIVGILNVTPDSFYDGGKYFDENEAVLRGLQLESQGADILDIGGESTRPFALPVSEEEELARVIPVIRALKSKLKIPISIDTRKPKVAKEALENGAVILNDIQGFSNDEMIGVAKQFNAKIICMHMQGLPENMQQNPSYREGVLPHLMDWFEDKIKLLILKGISKENLILDPGIGFGKTVAHNVEIIQNLQKFKSLGVPLFIGASRKSFLSKILQKPTVELESATLALHCFAALNGADYIRVHDVASHKDAMAVLNVIKPNL